jgi:hypothetical protein
VSVNIQICIQDVFRSGVGEAKCEKKLYKEIFAGSETNTNEIISIDRYIKHSHK